MNNLPNINKCNLAIIGLGYVGLPVAIEFALKKKSVLDQSKLDRKIIGFDISQERIKQLKNNIDITKEIDTQILENTNKWYNSQRRCFKFSFNFRNIIVNIIKSISYQANNNSNYKT